MAICSIDTAIRLKSLSARQVSTSDCLVADGHQDLGEMVAQAARLLVEAGCILEDRLNGVVPWPEPPGSVANADPSHMPFPLVSL